MILLSNVPKAVRVSPLKILREKYPERVWKSKRAGYGSWIYVSGGWIARWACHLEDDGDVGSRANLYLYKNDGPTELIL